MNKIGSVLPCLMVMLLFSLEIHSKSRIVRKTTTYTKINTNKNTQYALGMKVYADLIIFQLNTASCLFFYLNVLMEV